MGKITLSFLLIFSMEISLFAYSPQKRSLEKTRHDFHTSLRRFIATYPEQEKQFHEAIQKIIIEREKEKEKNEVDKDFLWREILFEVFTLASLIFRVNTLDPEVNSILKNTLGNPITASFKNALLGSTLSQTYESTMSGLLAKLKGEESPTNLYFGKSVPLKTMLLYQIPPKYIGNNEFYKIQNRIVFPIKGPVVRKKALRFMQKVALTRYVFAEIGIHGFINISRLRSGAKILELFGFKKDFTQYQTDTSYISFMFSNTPGLSYFASLFIQFQVETFKAFTELLLKKALPSTSYSITGFYTYDTSTQNFHHIYFKEMTPERIALADSLQRYRFIELSKLKEFKEIWSVGSPVVSKGQKQSVMRISNFLEKSTDITVNHTLFFFLVEKAIQAKNLPETTLALMSYSLFSGIWMKMKPAMVDFTKKTFLQLSSQKKKKSQKLTHKRVGITKIGSFYFYVHESL